MTEPEQTPQTAPTRQRRTGFGWSAARRQAVALVGDDIQTDDAIAAQVGVQRSTLALWKKHPTFQEAVVAYREKARAAVEAEGIANKQNRLRAYNSRWEGMQRIISARAATPTPLEENQERPCGNGDDDEPPAPVERIPVPGWETGLLVKSVRMMGKAIEIRYEVDGTLLKELRDLEKQAAQEAGQWTEKVEHSGDLTVRRYVGVDVDEV